MTIRFLAVVFILLGAALAPFGIVGGVAGAQDGTSSGVRPHANQNITSFTLDSGMRVVLAPDFRSPVVVHMVWYKAGAVDEPPGKTGIAHMLEHMMFKGTDTLAPGEFSRRVAKLGGQDNAFTSQDYTAYYQKIARDNLAQVVGLEADRIANLNISDETFQPERDVVLEERNMRVDSKPISLFFELFNKKHFPAHPYGNPVIGWRAHIENYTLEDARSWYHKFYAPQSAIVVFAGALAEDEARWLAETYYSDLENPAVTPERPTVQPAPLFKEAKRFEHTDPRTQLPLWVRSYRAPSLHAGVAGAPAPTPTKIAALTLLSDVLGGGLTSRLYQSLVMDKKLADSASARYRALSRYESSLSVVVQPKKGVSLEKIEREVERVIADLKKNGLTQDELSRAKIKAKSADIFARDDLFEAAYRLGIWLTVGGTLDGYRNWLSDIDAVTLEDVRLMADRVIVKQQSTTGILLPEQTE